MTSPCSGWRCCSSPVPWGSSLEFISGQPREQNRGRTHLTLTSATGNSETEPPGRPCSSGGDKHGDHDGGAEVWLEEIHKSSCGRCDNLWRRPAVTDEAARRAL